MRSRQEKEQIAARYRRNARIMGAVGVFLLLLLLFGGDAFLAAARESGAEELARLAVGLASAAAGLGLGIAAGFGAIGAEDVRDE